MWQVLKTFRSREDGAITVDWVAITAAIVVLGLLIIASIQADAITGVENMWASVQ